MEFRRKNPLIPEITEAARMANLELLMIVLSLKARRVMKIDIVNPMPAKRPVPVICFQLIFWGKDVILSLTAIKQKARMPNGLPAISPAMIPITYLSDKIPVKPLSTIIAVLARAKRGRIIKATGLCKACCILSEGELPLSLRNGIAKASRTPETVACTPLRDMKYHIIIPPATNGNRLCTFNLLRTISIPKTPRDTARL
jgi:hypothetical protein